MTTAPKDFFAEKAKDYDQLRSRTENVDNIAQAMLKKLSFTKEMRILDFGSGTGLLLSGIAPYVSEITAVDVSPSMNEVLQSKIDAIDCKLQIKEMDLTREPLNDSFDAIISSMTIHHIEDILALFKKFYALLNPGGLIALADLDTEDGSFHSENTGVHHLGFNRQEFLSLAQKAGFKDLKIQDASILEKPEGNYPVFLLTGKK